MIDFSKINAFEAGQRESFEELICVLAKRNKPEGAIEYQRIEGSGGDGGVEALWVFSDGTKIGYQAKYFLSLTSNSWKQIDKSVIRAIEVHPELKRYVVSIPCSLSHKKSYLGLGSSAWEKWEARVEKWSTSAKNKGLKIQFEPWTATDLTEQLLREENSGVYQHWFSGDVLNTEWFKRHVKIATKTLEDRYNPQDHVETVVESMFDCVARGPLITQRIVDCFTELASATIPSTEFTKIKQQPHPKVIKQAEEAWNEVLLTQSLFSVDFSYAWSISSVKEPLKRLQTASRELQRFLYSTERNLDDGKNKRVFEEIEVSLRKLSAACHQMQSLLEYEGLAAEHTRCAIVHGSAGAGKSHLFGHIAEERAASGQPTVLLLGQSFSNTEIWGQIGSALGLSGRSAEHVLRVINAAGERKGVRALLLFDAINEGAGARFWREQISSLIEWLQPYPNIAAVFSCREEYLRFAFPEAVLTRLPTFLVSGFSTNEEMEQAAITYLDSKGIARPNTPWLSPEFSNPLFLKSASEALQAKGATEFPRGLHGLSELMAYYLDSLSWRTGLREFDPDQLSGAIKQAVQAIARHMANTGRDFVEFDNATQLVGKCFSTLREPSGNTWLGILIETSIFRRDPPPYEEYTDPLNPPPELVRFSFQRFQDHLMARVLVTGIDKAKPSQAFQPGGSLSFIFYDGESNKGLQYDYAGLLGSLSTIYPEALGVEFADTIPDDMDLWSDGYLLQEAFGESCKWRRTDAFTDATLALFNRLEDDWVDKLGLLLEVSMTIGHPWNALFLHSWLCDPPMPKRDSHWTRWVNWSSQHDGSQIERIISWALKIRGGPVDVRHLELASVVLAWLLTSSRRTLRDRATKALTTILLEHPSVFGFVLSKLSSSDDPYLIERLYASAFGACCVDRTPERLRDYSRLVFDKVFSNGEPPVALLTRDYALGIMELAASLNTLGSDLSLEKCLPPYKSEPPCFGLNEDEVEELADERGGKEIFRSASSDWGDYGKYSIPGRVRTFLTTSLSDPKPLPNKERKRLCYEEVIEPYQDRVDALKALEEYTQYPRHLIINIISPQEEGVEKGEAEQHAEEYENARLEARERLERLLTTEEVERLSREYFRDGLGSRNYDSVNVQQCRLWVTKRAYELGWNAELFPNDGHGTGYSRHENDLERIGKKYQRIALDEIQARLADNFWALSGWPEEPAIFRYTHHDFRRNLEPTILPDDLRFSVTEQPRYDWIVHPRIKLPDVTEENLKDWPFEQDPSHAIGDKLVRIDDSGSRWLVLFEFNLDQRKYQELTPGEHGLRYEEFRLFYCIFLKRKAVTKFVKFLEHERSLDAHLFQPREFVDGPYLLEAFWRATWQSEKFAESLWNAPEGCEYAIPIADYHWESHLDKTLPNGFHLYMPQMWFANELGLKVSPDDIQTWVDADRKIVIQTRRPFQDQNAVVIDETTLDQYAKRCDVVPVWILIAERNTWPKGRNDESCWRRSEGATWRENGEWRQVSWNRDTKR